eukprot:PhM_4_TR582/c0_g1_i1/m.86324
MNYSEFASPNPFSSMCSSLCDRIEADVAQLNIQHHSFENATEEKEKENAAALPTDTYDDVVALNFALAWTPGSSFLAKVFQLVNTCPIPDKNLHLHHIERLVRDACDVDVRFAGFVQSYVRDLCVKEGRAVGSVDVTAYFAQNLFLLYVSSTSRRSSLFDKLEYQPPVVRRPPIVKPFWVFRPKEAPHPASPQQPPLRWHRCSKEETMILTLGNNLRVGAASSQQDTTTTPTYASVALHGARFRVYCDHVDVVADQQNYCVWQCTDPSDEFVPPPCEEHLAFVRSVYRTYNDCVCNNNSNNNNTTEERHKCSCRYWKK